jgi:hypothetical protein
MTFLIAGITLNKFPKKYLHKNISKGVRNRNIIKGILQKLASKKRTVPINIVKTKDPTMKKDWDKINLVLKGRSRL